MIYPSQRAFIERLLCAGVNSLSPRNDPLAIYRFTGEASAAQRGYGTSSGAHSQQASKRQRRGPNLGARLSRTGADPLGNTVLVCRLGCSEELPHQTWVHGLACSTHLALAERGHGVGTQLEDKAATMLGEQRGMPAAAGTVQGDRECRRHLVGVAGGSGELRAGASVLLGV